MLRNIFFPAPAALLELADLTCNEYNECNEWELRLHSRFPFLDGSMPGASMCWVGFNPGLSKLSLRKWPYRLT